MDLKFTLQSDGFRNLSSRQEWWEVQENCSNFHWLPHSKRCGFLTLYTFNDKAFPEGLSFISGGGYRYFIVFVHYFKQNSVPLTQVKLMIVMTAKIFWVIFESHGHIRTY